MEIKIKEFKDLELDELYQILQLRIEVFVVEQVCVYQDIDGKDKDAIHVMGFAGKELVAYTRCFAPGIYFEHSSIGRVIVKESYRKLRYGHIIMKASIKEIETRFKTSKIKLSAQQYLTDFYESHGFKKKGKGYLEDGIPHIAMVKNEPI